MDHVTVQCQHKSNVGMNPRHKRSDRFMMTSTREIAGTENCSFRHISSKCEGNHPKYKCTLGRRCWLPKSTYLRPLTVKGDRFK